MILVTGAGGEIGRHVVRHLLDSGRQVRAMVRSAERSPFERSPFAAEAGLEVVVADVRDEAALRRCAAGAAAVVHLAAAKHDEPESEAVNIGGSENLARACREQGVSLIVNIGTQSSGLSRPGLYGRSKALAEQALLASGVPTVRFRVSVVYSDLESGVFGTLVKAARLPLTPVLGPGTAVYWPIHVDDLAEAIARALDRPEVAGQSLDVGGPDRVTLDDLIRLLASAQGRRARLVHAPAGVALLGARAAALVPRSPISVSNVVGSIEPVPMDVEATFAALGFRPRPLAEGLRELFQAEPAADAEAALLLRYVAAPSGRDWRVGEREARLYRQALEAHGIAAGHHLDGSVYRHPALLGGLDLLTRLRHPAAVLQQKLLVAAAIVESDPRSAEWLLPRAHSRPGLLGRLLAPGTRVLGKALVAAALLIRPGFVRRNAGL